MIIGSNRTEEARLEEASAWIVRLQQGEPDDALAFDHWLASAPENARAYDRALGVWYAYGAAATEVLTGLQSQQARRAPRPGLDRRWLAGGGLAAAAALALAVLPRVSTGPSPETFVTSRGEHRTIRLADGSVIDMNAGSTLTVRLARGERHVAMGEGEAIFSVAKDPRRPFVIAAGEHTVRVVGTRFDVRHRGQALSVTVAEGVVDVGPAERGAGRALRLRSGQRLDRRPGEVEQVSLVQPQEVLGWRSGRLVYRDQPLSAVVADLNLQFDRPIRIEDPALGATRVSGVLVLDDQSAVIRRLALLTPLRAVPSADGIVLRRPGAAKQ
jgi:transmembrane sensor